MRIVLLGLASGLLFAPTAGADLRVGAGQRTSALKVIGENVRVDGQTSGAVIVIDGDLIVGPRGRVDSAVVIGGRIDTQSGGRISGEVFHIAGRWPRNTAWHLAAAFTILMLLRIVLFWVLVSSAIRLAARPLGGSLAAAGGVAPVKTLAVGALAVFGVGAAALVGALTVVGLPVAAALAGLLLGATATGLAVVFRNMQASASDRRLVLVALALPVAGDGLAALAAVLGMGAVLRHVADHAERGARPSRSARLARR